MHRIFKFLFLLQFILLLSFPKIAFADLLAVLPGRCKKLINSQNIASPRFLTSKQNPAKQRKLKRCRTLARKNYIRDGDSRRVSAVSLFSNQNALPSSKNLREGDELILEAPISDTEKNEYWLMWAFRFNSQVYFSTEKTLRIRFPDNGVTIVRLWIRERSTGLVSKQIVNVDVKNVAPEVNIELPSKIYLNERVSVRAKVADPGSADQNQGFSYLWQFDDKNKVDEGVSSQINRRFKTAGEHSVSLLVSDKDGASTFKQIEIQVSDSGDRRNPVPDPTSPPVSPPPPDSHLPELPTSGPAPLLSEWEEQMIKYGKQHCAVLSDTSQTQDHRLGTTYYDAEWVYYQIAEYTGDNSWIDCAQSAERAYRDGYAAEWDGKVPGYWNFTHGLLEDYRKTGDEASKAAAIQISKAAAYATAETPLEWTADAELSREVAYAIMSYINAEKLGAERNPRLEPLVKQALGHMNQWFVQRSTPYMRPFMVALTAQALIEYDLLVGNPEIVSIIAYAMDQVWEQTWLSAEETFQYTDRNHETGGTEPAYDLNLLIAPVYAWLYSRTGNNSYLEKADAIFAGGVKNAWLENGKQFNQNYRWSFAYLRWRN